MAHAADIQLAANNTIHVHTQILVPTSTVTVHWAIPEMRVGPPGTNDDIRFYLTARSGGVVVATTPIIASTTAEGTYDFPIPINVPDGIYDVGIKSHQHLTKILRNIALGTTSTILNFTQPDNSSSEGAGVLTAGDINGDGLSPATLGDDKINALDITTLLQQFGSTDKYARANLNQDGKVNALDLTIILKNFNLTGDH